MENEYTGRWWCPGENVVVSGILSIDEKSIILETDAPLPNSIIINGHSKNDKRITLYGCFNIGCAMNGFGNPSKYTANIVYVGSNFEAEEEIRFDKYSFRTSNLNEWIWNQHFDVESNPMKNTFNLNYNLPEPIKAYINDEYSIELETTLNLPTITVGKNEVNIKENTRVNFYGKTPKSLKEFLRLEYIFCCFMKIATGISQNRYDIYGFIGDKKIEINIPQQNLYKEKDAFPPTMPFTFRHVIDRWKNLIFRWYKMYEENEDIWNLYFSICNGDRNYIQHSFIFYTQVIESYHRRNFDKEDRREVKENIRKMIASCPQEHQDFLKNALKFSHEITFKERLEQLCDNCEILDVILKAQHKIDRETFIKNIKDNRNYYTHYDDSLEKKKLDFLSLHYITMKINIMIHYYMLKDLGFDKNESYEILKRLDTEITMPGSLNELDNFVDDLTKSNHNNSK